MLNTALKGPVNIIPTAIMLKIWTVFPDIHNMIAFMGMDFMGEVASSHAFLDCNWANCWPVGGVLLGVVDLSFWIEVGNRR